MRYAFLIFFLNASAFGYTESKEVLELQMRTRQICAQMLANLAIERANLKKPKQKPMQKPPPQIELKQKEEQEKRRKLFEEMAKQPKPEIDEFAIYKVMKENDMLPKNDQYSLWKESLDYLNYKYKSSHSNPEPKQEEEKFLDKIIRISKENKETPIKQDEEEE